jgi:type IV secretory pathway VirB10-like protein
MATAKKITPAVVEAVKKPAPSKAPAAPKPAAKSVVATKAPAAKKIPPKTVAAASKPATKAAPKAAPKATGKTAAKPAAAKKGAAVAKKLDAAQRANYVEVAAFYIAERRGFAAANPMDDWLAAEAEIDRLIATGHFGN